MMDNVMTDRLGGLRFLVVEDDYLIATDMVDLLELMGARTIGPVGRVEDALALLEVEGDALDGAVLDLDLSGRLAYPVADALAARGLPFVFATGFAADAIDPAYRGCTRLEKPVDPRALLAALLRSR